jgi:NTE family protein
MARHKRAELGSARRASGAGSTGRRTPRVVLVLQGGGALGAYHVGAYEALQEAGYAPDWVSGISIGAISAAVIAGAPPEQRVERLDEFWHEISRPDNWGTALQGPMLKLFNQLSATQAVLFGQPNFWFPRFPSPLLLPQVPPEMASFCDTTPMSSTLSRLVDFERINRGAVRLSLGATQVRTGTLVFFDNTRQRIGPEHVLASGSLPPGFPATRVDGELYWDGGCVSNTPLVAVYLDEGNDDMLVFMIDLWGAMGEPPTSMDAVSWRQKQIQYASRTAHSIRSLATEHNLRRALAGVDGRVPKGAVDIQAVGDAPSFESNRDIHIVHVIYHPTDDQVSESDAEFSRPSIAKRRAAGYEDLRRAIHESPWTRHRPAGNGGTLVHRVHRGRLQANVPVLEPSLRFMQDG